MWDTYFLCGANRGMNRVIVELLSRLFRVKDTPVLDCSVRNPMRLSLLLVIRRLCEMFYDPIGRVQPHGEVLRCFLN